MHDAFDVAELESLPLLSDVPATQISDFARLLATQTFDSDAFILRAGSDSKKIFIVRSGLARVCLPHDAPSREVSPQCGTLLAVEGPGTVLGEINFLNGQGHSAHVVAIVKTVCWWISSAQFAEFCDKNPLVWKNVARIAATRLQRKNERVSLLSSRDAERVIASVLLDYAKNCETAQLHGTLDLPCALTQDEIGLMAGFCRRTVSETMTSLSMRHILRPLRGRRVAIANVRKLKLIRDGKPPR